MSDRYKKEYAAFTLVEMLIVAPIVILIIGLIMNLMIQMTGEVMETRAAASITSDIQNALNTIENDVVNSGAFLATNNISLTSPQGKDDGVTPFKNAHATDGPAIILNSYGTTDNPLKSELKYIYTKTPNLCNSSTVSSNPRLMFNTVYFIKNNALWRRIIAADNYEVAGCETPWQIPSCSPGVSGVFCKSDDKKMVEGVTASNLKINYYPNPNSTTPNAVAIDSAQSDTARQAALRENNTISVTITSNITVAGRDITQTGTIRASSKNNYIVATPQKPVITTQPTDVSKLDNETNITFTAQAFDSTSVQWQFSNGIPNLVTKIIDWNNVVDQTGVISGATTNTLTLATINNTMDGYLYRAVFTNSEGSINSNYARLNVGDSIWRIVGAASQPGFQSGWTNYNNGYNTAAFRKTSSGVVVVRGLIMSGATASETPIFQLPDKYRPNYRMIFITQSNGVATRLDIDESGYIRCVSGCSASWLSIEGLHFIPNTGRYPQNKIVNFFNNWQNWLSYSSSGNYSPAIYVQDDLYRIHLAAVLYPGSFTNDARIFDLPSNILPDQNTAGPAVSGSTSAFGIEYRSGLSGAVTKGEGSSYMSFNLMYLPASQANKWTNLTLKSGWSNYGSIYSTARYTKSSDGLVTLKGYLTPPGTLASGNVIAQLPAGFIPSARVLHNGICGNVSTGHVYSRIDINNVGEIIYMTGGGSSRIVLLDGITFYADQ